MASRNQEIEMLKWNCLLLWIILIHWRMKVWGFFFIVADSSCIGVTSQFIRIQSQNSCNFARSASDEEKIDVFAKMPNNEAANVLSQFPLEDIFTSSLVPKRWRLVASIFIQFHTSFTWFLIYLLRILAVTDPKCRKRIQRQCEKGLPPTVRGEIWSLLIGSTPLQFTRDASYQELKLIESPFKDQIRRDISRTFPTNFFFMFPQVYVIHFLHLNDDVMM